MNKVILRAITAYTRTDMKTSTMTNVSVNGIEKDWLGKAYVLLEDEISQQLVAVYRCMNRGELKRLKRWPPGLTEKTSPQSISKKANVKSVPAILELSPIKDGPKVGSASKKNSQTKSHSKSIHQTDLFDGTN